uniref:tRNA pseudouridine synthase B n=1 Tax=Zeugodacus cucurbitae TaxID=28588 RepID=A0A0A1WKI9_ZEUCU
MSSELNYQKVKQRKPIRTYNSFEANQSADIDDEWNTFEEEQHDSSMELTSDELSSQSLYEPESSKPYNRNNVSSTSTLKGSPYINLSSKDVHRAQSAYVDKKSNSKCGRTVLLIILILIIAVWVYASKSEEKKCSFETLRQKYTDQDSKIWHILSSGVNNILRDRTKNPGVYLFLHNDGSKLKSIVREIATQTSNCFGGRSQLVEMNEHDFTSPNAMEDYGYAIMKFREKIQKGRVALIVNLNDIPAESARALHTICDTYSPVAEDIVIYLTLVIQSQSGNNINIARETLNNLWGSKLKYNELEPLVTRVTDQIITLH